MRNKYYLLAAIAVCCSCQGTIETISEQGHPTDTPSGVFFSAELENDDTKVVLQNDGSKVYFAPGDEILVIQGNKSGRFVSTLQSPGTRSDFSGETVFDEDGEPFWALYPYTTNYKLSKSGITITLPEKQKASKGSVDSSAFYMIARSNTHKLSFKNVCGGIKFSVATDSVSMVLFRGNNNERIAGEASVSLDENGIPECVSTNIYSTTITIVPSDSNYFKKGVWYYCAVFPVELSRGYTLSFFKEDKDNKATIETGVFEYSNPVSIKRSVWGRIGDADDSVEYGLEAGNGYLLYRTTDNQIIDYLNFYGYRRDSYDGEYYLDFGDGEGAYFYGKSYCHYDANSDYFVLDESRVRRDIPWGAKWPFYSLSDKNRIKEIVMTQNTLHPACYYYTNLERVTLANEVWRIDYRAFEGCSNLREIKMPASLRSIYYRAFYGCSNLASITIPRGVSSISKDAFLYCSGLTEVQISDLSSWLNISFENEYSNPLRYAHYLYQNGTNLKDITIPKGKEVKKYAFVCGHFDSLTIPSDVQTADIDETAFGNCYSETINIETPFDKWIFGRASNIVFHEGLDSIPKRAIENHEEVKSVSLPSTISSIGDYAFSNCTGITDISIPEGVTSIGDYAFSNCTGITDVSIPESVTSIGKGAFSGCSNLECIRIPSSVTSVGEKAFENCDSIKRVEIGSDAAYRRIKFSKKSLEELIFLEGSIHQIGKIEFQSMENLRSVILSNSITSVESHAFCYCPNLEYVKIPSSVTSFNDDAFYESMLNRLDIGSLAVFQAFGRAPAYFRGTKEILLLDDLPTDTIPVGHFQNTSICSITIPSQILYISSMAFRGCLSLKNVSLSSVISIGESAFSGCTSLQSINIPEGVTSVGASAFEDCTSLQSINIPESVTEIGRRAFYGCTSLQCINIPEGVTSIGEYAFAGCTSLESITVPKSVNSIANGTFSNCSNITSAIITKGVTSIGESAFNGCTSLQSINIPESVTEIGRTAFHKCECLKRVTIIPGSLTSIGRSAFYGCTSLQSINIPEGVTSVGEYAFYGCTSLQSINIPESVISIGNSVFSGCSNLSSITIPESVTSIGEYAFSGCTSLQSINIPESVISIGNSVFSGCSNLSSITIPESVTSIGEYAFAGCTSLESITIPKSVNSIANGTFSNCSNLASFPTSEGVKSIGERAFYKCISLTDITIPEGVVSIGNYAFYGNKKLTKVVLPESLESIGGYAFASPLPSPSLSIIIKAIVPPTAGRDSFFDESINVRSVYIYVPDDSLEVYKSQWSFNKRAIYSINDYPQI